MVVAKKDDHYTTPLDPLVFLPIPDALPEVAQPELNALLCLIDDALAGKPTAYPLEVLITNLRLALRNSNMLVNTSRLSSAQARSELDLADTKLREAEYEDDRVKREMRDCEGFDSLADDVDMDDEATFKLGASEEVLASLPSVEDDGYANALLIARLEQELRHIEEREATAAQLSKERSAVIRENKEMMMKHKANATYMNDLAKSTTIITKKLKDVV